MHPLNKYDDLPEPRPLASRLNYESLALQVLTYCGEDDLRQFVRRLVFMVLSGNADAHLKNWSLIYPDGRTPRLSPAYDQVATIAYEDYDRELALPFGGSLEFAAVSRAGFRRLAAALRRDPEALVGWVDEDVARIMDAYAAGIGPLSLRARHALGEHHARLRGAAGSLLRP